MSNAENKEKMIESEQMLNDGKVQEALSIVNSIALADLNPYETMRVFMQKA